jgi:phospholipase/carboxylesterase
MNSKLFEYCTTDKPKYLVILLHGYGSNGENLINLAHELKYVLPEAHYISPNAIQPWEGGFPDSYQWFSLYNGFDRKGLLEIAGEIKNANKILTNFIEAQLARFNLTDDKLFIVGFSQGAMMSMYQGLAMKNKPAGIVAFSGKLILPEMLGQQSLSKPNICLIHGESDSVVPFENFLEAKKVLEEQKITHESHAVAGLDHSINLHAIRMAQAFIKKIIS